MSDGARRSVAVLILAILWCGLVLQLMVVDVWDETRVLQLVFDHSLGELVSSNWLQAEGGGTVLFRPLPSLLLTVVAQAVGEPDLAWRVLRAVNAVLLLATLSLLLAVIRRLRGPELVRDILFTVIFLFSASALITAGWFANVFDATAAALVALAVYLLVRERGVAAGITLGLAFFCKEIAVLGLIAVASLAWCGEVKGRPARSCWWIASAMLLVYGLARWAVVSPGSAADVRQYSLGGLLSGLLFLPETLVWQIADVAVPGLGLVVFVLVLGGLRSWAARWAVAGTVGAAALVYGPLIHYGATPLLAADNFVARLYLVPAALTLLFVALHGRRVALLLLLPTVVWGGYVTVERHLRFQAAYVQLFDAVAAERLGLPVEVDSEVYPSLFHDRRRGVVLGSFPYARWRLTRDGRVYHRPHPAVDWIAHQPR